eukprot:jgi/Botrbrau1/16708/Bobra.0263s0005.1
MIKSKLRLINSMGDVKPCRVGTVADAHMRVKRHYPRLIYIQFLYVHTLSSSPGVRGQESVCQQPYCKRFDGMHRDKIFFHI